MNDLTASPPPADSTPLRIEDLLRPEAFPHPVGPLELRETDHSWVILTGPFAYKLKKWPETQPTDAATLTLKRRLCEEELRLNRRYAAEIYLDVVPIGRVQGRVVVGAADHPIDYAVRMNQFEATDELGAQLAANRVVLPEVVSLAERLANVHLRAPVVIRNLQAATRHIQRAVLDNLAELIAHLPQNEVSPDLGPLIDWVHDNARSLEACLQRRAESKCIRECHGELRAANIVRWHGHLVAFDCIEPGPQARHIDVMDDLAFLVMDLVSYGRVDLAFPLLSRYLEITGDYDGVALLRFYAVHRALVRAKVDALMGEHLPQQAAEFAARLQRRLSAAAAWASPSARPLLVLMHGPSGSGKSWLSERLIPQLSAIRLRSDLERNRVAGITPLLPANAEFGWGRLATELTHRTYERLADCAKPCLQAGFNTIVDATFLDPADRTRFLRLAEGCGAACVILACHGAPAISFGRAHRSRQRNPASDAHLAALQARSRTIPSFSASEREHVIEIDTADTNAVPLALASIGPAEAGISPGTGEREIHV